ncbi:PREDICTED: mitochondrial import receptor subunit TOM70-like [Rhagoletis zephyria]|uniref:mitochondrial import receptor subunit TOM70-like n=1 Tax=Rhagoletis zephyria TaxID=28612 RepID=UPI0008118A9C|nr:PREDICTED: mitochondrial import receptor subunit TOM70-like [Rhagoletis zephyria]
MKILSELNAQISSSTRLKWALAVATPIVVGSAGACLYYYYRNGETSAERAAAEKKAAYLKKLANDPLAKANDLKNKGNEFFRLNKYEDALRMYNEAIAVLPSERTKELATCYQNKAACYEHLKQFDQVIEDCTKAIENDKLYVKAYLRRGKANEVLEKYEDATFDFYVAACSSQFQNSDYISLLYQVLEKFSFAKANDIVGKRKQFTFQKYLLRHIVNKFSRDPLKAKFEELKSNYNEIVTTLLNDNSNDESLSVDDLLLKGTIEMYIGKHEAGQRKLRKLIDNAEVEVSYKVNALLKLTEFNFQNNKLEEARRWLTEAENLDSLNPDVHYIRSQLHIINKDYDAAMKDLVSAAELDPKFSCAIGQKLYIEYQQLLMINDIAKKNAALKEFEMAIEKFPKSNELLLLFFQVLLSNNEMAKAEGLITKALENDPEDPTLYVYKALVYIETSDLEKTREYLDLALKLDPKCSFAYEMLADLCSKLENFKDALSYLESAINCSTTFEDVKNLILKHKTLELQLKAPKFGQ